MMAVWTKRTATAQVKRGDENLVNSVMNDEKSIYLSMSDGNMLFLVMNDEKMIYLFTSDENMMYQALSDLNKNNLHVSSKE